MVTKNELISKKDLTHLVKYAKIKKNDHIGHKKQEE